VFALPENRQSDLFVTVKKIVTSMIYRFFTILIIWFLGVGTGADAGFTATFKFESLQSED
jgi:hypothetical protein